VPGRGAVVVEVSEDERVAAVDPAPEFGIGQVVLVALNHRSRHQ
jgi:hypothetical protein